MADVALGGAPSAASGNLPGAADTSPPRAPLAAVALPASLPRTSSRAPSSGELLAAALDDHGASDELTPDRVRSIHRSPLFLEELGRCRPDHELRMGLSFKVWHYPLGGRERRLQGFDWTYEVPSEDTLGRMICEGTLQPGRYVVQPLWGNRHGARIELNIYPIGATQRPRDVELLERVLDRYLPAPKDAGHALVDEAQAATVARLEERLEELESEREELAARLDEAEAALAAGTVQGEHDEKPNPMREIGRGVAEAGLEVLLRGRRVHDVEHEELPAHHRNGSAS